MSFRFTLALFVLTNYRASDLLRIILLSDVLDWNTLMYHLVLMYIWFLCTLLYILSCMISFSLYKVKLQLKLCIRNVCRELVRYSTGKHHMKANLGQLLCVTLDLFLEWDNPYISSNWWQWCKIHTGCKQNSHFLHFLFSTHQ